jgi:four helix bundle protein
VIQLTERDGIRSDGDFCGQARRAANSACRNLAEGFWRYSHREFAHFVNIARGSLGELLDRGLSEFLCVRRVAFSRAAFAARGAS